MRTVMRVKPEDSIEQRRHCLQRKRPSLTGDHWLEWLRDSQHSTDPYIRWHEGQTAPLEAAR